MSLDFIGIGAQKAATSWLFDNLKKLPDFSLLPRKELHYFDRSRKYPTPNVLSETLLVNRLGNQKWTDEALIKVRRALKNNPDRANWMRKWLFSDYTDEWYLSLFDGLNGLKGEITPSYSVLDQEDIERMYRVVPDAKVIFLLRNPVDRAWSYYRFIMKNRSSEKTEEPDLNNVKELLDVSAHELRSDYLRTINQYLNVFPGNQILLGFYDAVLEEPERLLKEIVQFIGGDPSNVSKYCEVSERSNVSLKMKHTEEIEEYLKDKYYDLINRLAERYGGYCSKWLEDTYGETSQNQDRLLRPTIILDR